MSKGTEESLQRGQKKEAGGRGYGCSKTSTRKTNSTLSTEIQSKGLVRPELGLWGRGFKVPEGISKGGFSNTDFTGENGKGKRSVIMISNKPIIC